jgi:hypothetical protein
MPFLATIQQKIGESSFSRLEKLADEEVGLALKMPLKDRSNQDQFYNPRFLLDDLLTDSESFENAGLKVSSHRCDRYSF